MDIVKSGFFNKVPLNDNTITALNEAGIMKSAAIAGTVPVDPLKYSDRTDTLTITDFSAKPVAEPTSDILPKPTRFAGQVAIIKDSTFGEGTAEQRRFAKAAGHTVVPRPYIQ